MQIVVSLSVSPRRDMEADDDVDTDCRKYYATWCQAMKPHPKTFTQDGDPPDPRPDWGPSCSCAPGVTL